MTSIVTTVVEIRDDVKWLKRAVHALLVDRNLTVPENDESSEDRALFVQLFSITSDCCDPKRRSNIGQVCDKS